MRTGRSSFGGGVGGAELEATGGWDIILGDPNAGLAPTDPLMVQSIDPRTGANPVTGEALAPPGAGPENPINGSERLIAARDDLQYACIFELPEPRDCSLPGAEPCDCSDPSHYSPLCGTGQPTLQLRAKAYPAPRQLGLVRAVGSQGVVGSICPAQLDQPARPDWGYRSVLDGFAAPLMTSVAGSCLPHSLAPDAEGQVSCRVVEARHAPSCDCTLPGRAPVPLDDPIRRLVGEDEIVAMMRANCLCELVQLSGEPGEICRNDVAEVPLDGAGEEISGWCYIDATLVPPVGNPELAQACPYTYKRTVRFVGGGEPLEASLLFIACLTGELGCTL